MILRVSTKPPIELRRRCGHEFSRAVSFVTVDEDTAARIKADDGLVSREVTAAERDAYLERASARAKSGPAAGEDFGSDAPAEIYPAGDLDPNRRDEGAAKLRAEVLLRESVELERDQLAARVKDLEAQLSGREFRDGLADAGEFGGTDESPADTDETPAAADAADKSTPNDGGPQRLRPPGRKSRS